MSLNILNLLLDFSLRAILKKFLIFGHFQPPILMKMIVIKANGVYATLFTLSLLSGLLYKRSGLTDMLQFVWGQSP